MEVCRAKPPAAGLKSTTILKEITGRCPEAKLMTDPDTDSEIMLAQFNRLIQELLRGGSNRNTFRPWEVELLLDMESCDLKESRRKEILKRYQRAVQKQLERGAAKPLKLSEYLEAQRVKRERLKAMKSGSGE